MPNAIISIERNGGFGIAVVQRLCKTSIKKNLYFEIKDKVIEETFNGVHVEKHPKKVKVYGVDSTKAVRARLIEILMERVMYHKDKFTAPILWEEMRSMEVKKSGKVEHSDKTHDDNVFSYLMALYVWYEGKNLLENFNIRKCTIKTDEMEDIEELDIEDALEKKTAIDFRSSEFEANEDISRELEWIEANKYVTSDDIKTKQYIDNYINRNTMIGYIQSTNTKYNITITDHRGIEDNMAGSVTLNSIDNPQYPGHIDMPDSIFTDDNDDMNDILDVDDINNSFVNGNMYAEYHTPLAGNLSRFYDEL
jgi:hypothetical protein